VNDSGQNAVHGKGLGGGRCSLRFNAGKQPLSVSVSERPGGGLDRPPFARSVVRSDHRFGTRRGG
jgi:hypothetical protein